MIPAENPIHEVTVTRILDADPERVWDAWTRADLFARWFFTPPFVTPAETVALDVRPGGRWTATQESTEDDTELPFVGEYLEVDAPSRLVLTFEDPANPLNPDREVATVTLLRLADGRTEMTLHQQGHLPAEEYALMAQGYGRFFDNLAELLGEA